MTVTASDLDDGRLLLELARDVTSSLDLQQVLDKSLSALRQLIDFNGGSIQLIEDGWLRMVAGDPAPTPEAFEFRLPLGQGFGGRVASTGEPLYSPDATTDQRAHPEGRKRASVAGTHSWFGAPLIVQGETIGIVQFDDLQIDHFPPPVQARILMFLPTVSAAVQNAQLYRREREAVRQLQEAKRLKRDFVATVSHELKTPLTVVRGFSTMLASGDVGADPEQLALIGERIEEASTRLEAMVMDMLHISGIEIGHLAVSLQTTDVASTVVAAVAAADQRSHTIEMSFADEIGPAWTDEVRLSQVLAKVLDNAQKFSPDGTTIRVHVRGDTDSVVIAIDDEGKGVPDDMLEHVFDAFVQVDSSATRTEGGMGTGLYIARGLSDAIGATIAVESTLGVGSRFTVTLPTSARRP